MSCISSNFSSFFLDSLNDPSEFAKYLSNGENRVPSSSIAAASPYDEFMISSSAAAVAAVNSNSITTNGNSYYNNNININNGISTTTNASCDSNQYQLPQITTTSTSRQLPQQQQQQLPIKSEAAPTTTTAANSSSHFDGSFEFLKYLRYSADYNDDSVNSIQSNTTTHSSLIDLDNSTPLSSHHKAKSILPDGAYDHGDSKHNIFDLQNQIGHNSNSCSDPPSEQSILPQHILATSNSNPSSECSDSSNPITPKTLIKFIIKDNFDVHPSHKVEEGIFQHMNKLPSKKKDSLKSYGVTFTGHMSISDKSVIVDNFTKFCQEYNITDHRPFLTLNQSGMPKAEQIKFARYLGQGLPTFTLFCIYSNYKNLFCLKRFENYTKGTYDLQYILDKTKRFLSCTTADLKSITQQQQQQQPNENSNHSMELQLSPNCNSNSGVGGLVVKNELLVSPTPVPITTPINSVQSAKSLEHLYIKETYDVHETHRIEDGIFTHIGRLPPKKQELLKQFGIQSNHNVTYYEKYIIIDNYIKFCNEYKITDHRPFLDFYDSGLPKCEQIKFVRFLGQGLPNLTLYKIYLAFKDVLALNRIEKITVDGYNLDVILKKKKKNLYNRMHAAVHRESTEAAKQAHRESLAS